MMSIITPGGGLVDWTKVLADLRDAGMTQAEIAAWCGSKQPAISALARGETRMPNFDLGHALLALHLLRVKVPAVADTPQA